jgi:hypothetical protein
MFRNNASGFVIFTPSLIFLFEFKVSVVVAFSKLVCFYTTPMAINDYVGKVGRFFTVNQFYPTLIFASKY